MSRWQYEWRRSWPAVWADGFLERWRELLAADRHAHVFHFPEVVRHWSETCAGAGRCEPLVGLARDDHGNCVLLPWIVALRRGRWFCRRVLEPAGQSLFGYHDPLVAEGDHASIDWAGFWEASRRAVSPFCDQALFRFVHARYVQGAKTEPCGEQSPLLELAGVKDWESLLHRCSSSHRGDVRRQIRRLEARGELSLWIPGAGEAQEALADFDTAFAAAYEANRLRHADRCLFDSPGAREFATRILRDGLRAGWGHYAVLRLSGRPIAWHLGLIHKCELFYWLPTYDPDWKDFSPGKVFLALLLQQGLKEHWRSVHFLTGGHFYKLAWAPEPVELRTVRWHCPTLRGRALSFYDHRRLAARSQRT